MKRCNFIVVCLFSPLVMFAWERQTIWPEGKMPDAQPHQIAAMTDEVGKQGFNRDEHRVAYLEWYDAPATRKHCFQRTASPGTGSFTWLDRISDFLKNVMSDLKNKL